MKTRIYLDDVRTPVDMENWVEKEFAPYEPSLDLKELGFDEPCFGRYYYKESYPMLNPNSGETELVFEFGQYIKQTEITILAPLYQQAFRWFREKYNLEYQIIKSANGNYSAVIHLNTQEYLDKISTLHHACVDEVVDCYSYEEAELECLIKLIEIVKKNK
jgi:hypothetical protein